MMISLGLPAMAAEVTGEQVNKAIDQLKAYLYYKQDPQTGSWEHLSKPGGLHEHQVQVGGETALVTLSLLYSGESAQNPKLARAIKFLRQVEMGGVYAVAIRAHVWAHLPPEYMPMLEMDASWLVKTAQSHKLGLFHYEPKDSDRVDHSTTQYGMLGLWEASKRGLKIPSKHWKRWVEHFLSAQREDGGWMYSNNPDGITTGSMTAAGLTALFVGQQELYREMKRPDPKVKLAIKRGIEWLDQRFEGHNNPNANEWTYYYLYGIERVALASGISHLNGKDWYQSGAAHVIQNAGADKGIEDDFVNTAFALMFLARGKIPIWVNKLQLHSVEWANRPSDLYTLTQYLSDQCEKELNWQVVSIKLPPEKWLTAPVTFLSSNDPFTLTEKQKITLKRYLDLGGLLIANADGGSAEFTDSVRAMAAELYPQYELKRIPEDHQLYTCWRHLPDADRQTIYSLSNGARELIIMPEKDWGLTFQVDKNPGKTPTWDMAANIFAYATDRGALSDRLVKPYIHRTARGFRGEMTVGRASYEGNWLPEPLTWDLQSNYIFNETGLNITVTPASGNNVLSLDQIGSCDYPLIHLTGTHAINLTDAQRAAIQRYVERSGTILIETVGGHGEFSRSLDKQLSTLFDSYAVPLDSGDDTIISGKGLDGGQDNLRALYRRYPVVKLHYDPKPNLAAFLDENDRPMVIFSHEDLSLGMLSSRHSNILGYQPSTSRKLVTNIVLWANKQQMK